MLEFVEVGGDSSMGNPKAGAFVRFRVAGQLLLEITARLRFYGETCFELWPLRQSRKPRLTLNTLATASM